MKLANFRQIYFSLRVLQKMRHLDRSDDDRLIVEWLSCWSKFLPSTRLHPPLQSIICLLIHAVWLLPVLALTDQCALSIRVPYYIGKSLGFTQGTLRYFMTHLHCVKSPISEDIFVVIEQERAGDARGRRKGRARNHFFFFWLAWDYSTFWYIISHYYYFYDYYYYCYYY